MIAQIQTYFSYFLTQLVALALFLFILASFNLQIITATAQATSPAGNSTAPTTKPNLSKDFSQGQDSRIGTLKNCSVDNKSADYQTKLKTDPTEANTFIFNCLKDIIQIVITISVILAVMRLIFVGIKFLNTFGDEAALQGELSKTITGFVAGAVILGLFATIIQVVNPSALKIDKIFSAQVIADYKCLDKGVGGNKGTGCKDTKQGSGVGGSTAVSGGPQNDAEINAILKSDKAEDLAAKTELLKQLTACDTYIALTTKEATANCQKYQEYTGTYTASGDIVEVSDIIGNAFANGKYIVETVNGNVSTGKYIIGSGPKPTTIEFAYKFEGKCENSPLKKVGTVNRTEQVNFDGCIVKLS